MPDTTSEAEVNDRLFRSLRRVAGCLVLQRVQVFPRELDLVVFLRDSRELVSIELKRDRWEKLLRQATKTQLYCHYSIALLPEDVKHRVPIEEFEARGVGIGFYKVRKNGIQWSLVCEPVRSDRLNRSLKRRIYGLFTRHYGEAAYGAR